MLQLVSLSRENSEYRDTSLLVVQVKKQVQYAFRGAILDTNADISLYHE